jgi:C-terminal processing protease CtpA/Prc
MVRLLPLLLGVACSSPKEVARPTPVPAPPPPAPAVASPPAPLGPDDVPFNADQRAEELAFLRDALRDSYVHLEAKQKQWGVDLDALFKTYEPKIRGAATWSQYEWVMASFVSELHDGHVTWRRKRGKSEARRKVARLGLQTVLVADHLIVSEVWPDSSVARAGVKPGDRIIAVDGKSIADRLTALASLRSWSRFESARYDFAASWAASRYPADATPKSRTLSLESGGTTTDVVLVPETKGRGGPGKPVELAWRGDIAILHVRDLHGHVRDTRKEAVAAATAIFAKPAGLVIDLRGNGGGFEDGARAIVAQLAAKRITAGNTRVRLSKLAREVKAWSSLVEDPAKPGWSSRLPIEVDGVAARDYGAKIAVLIDAGCQSSCESLALLLRALGARLIGETTGGTAGAPVPVTLPRSGAIVQVPARAAYDPADKPVEGNGVVPDDVVLATRADLAARRDAALERAVDHVCTRKTGRC